MTDVAFSAGRDFRSPRHQAVKAWLLEQGFDLNMVPLDALITIEGDQVTADVYERVGKDLRITQKTLRLASEPSDLVMGITS